jgi:hypothetical protein
MFAFKLKSSSHVPILFYCDFKRIENGVSQSACEDTAKTEVPNTVRQKKNGDSRIIGRIEI